MVSPATRQVIDRAKELYARRLQDGLERRCSGQFVAIEPDSGDYFLGETFDEAVRKARDRHPTKLSHTIRVGCVAALELGVLRQ